MSEIIIYRKELQCGDLTEIHRDVIDFKYLFVTPEIANVSAIKCSEKVDFEAVIEKNLHCGLNEKIKNSQVEN